LTKAWANPATSWFNHEGKGQFAVHLYNPSVTEPLHLPHFMRADIVNFVYAVIQYNIKSTNTKEATTLNPNVLKEGEVYCIAFRCELVCGKRGPAAASGILRSLRTLKAECKRPPYDSNGLDKRNNDYRDCVKHWIERQWDPTRFVEKDVRLVLLDDVTDSLKPGFVNNCLKGPGYSDVNNGNFRQYNIFGVRNSQVTYVTYDDSCLQLEKIKNYFHTRMNQPDSGMVRIVTKIDFTDKKETTYQKFLDGDFDPAIIAKKIQ